MTKADQDPQFEPDPSSSEAAPGDHLADLPKSDYMEERNRRDENSRRKISGDEPLSDEEFAAATRRVVDGPIGSPIVNPAELLKGTRKSIQGRRDQEPTTENIKLDHNVITETATTAGEAVDPKPPQEK